MSQPETPAPTPRSTFRNQFDPAAEKVRRFSYGFWLLIILCFFLPFLSVTCSGTELITATGLDFVIGGEVEINEEFEEAFEDPFGTGETDLGTEPTEKDVPEEFESVAEDDSVDPSVFAILALAGAIAGLVLAFAIRSGRRDMLLSVVALVIILSLIIFRFDVGIDTEGAAGLSVDYRYGYWLAMLLALVAGIAHYNAVRKQKRPPPEQPPAAQPPPPSPT
ncbi:MAG: hypothetical protein ACRDLB_04425 [Actinomycetota bacterium]